MPYHIDIKLDREGLNPENFNFDELAKFLKVFSDIIAKDKSSAEDFRSSFVGIESNCINLKFLFSRKALTSYAAFIMFQKGLLFSLPSSFNSTIKELNSFCCRNKLTIELPLNRRIKETFSEQKPFKQVQTTKMKAETYIYGKLMDIGGSKPNAHVSLLNSDKTVTCSLPEDKAKELAARLYEVVGLQGIAYYENNELISFQVSDILPYRKRNNVDPFEELKKLGISKYFDGIDPNEYVKSIRA